MSAVLPYLPGRLSSTSTNGASPQAADTMSGRVAMPDATCTVDNKLVTSASHVLATLSSADGNNAVIRSVVPGNGSFVITLSGAPAGAQTLDWVLLNPQT